MNKLVVYFSYTGNTKMIANRIKKKINCDILEIKTVIPYSKDYETVVNDEQNSEASNYLPEIQDINIDLSKYDEIILGTPVWWYRPVPAIRTFLSKSDLSGKTVKPFATNAGLLALFFCKWVERKKGINMIISLAYIFLIAMSLSYILKKIKFPSLLAYIITGIIIGPYVLNGFDNSILNISAELRQIALIIILIRAGITLNIEDLKKVGRPAILMCFIPACFEIIGMCFWAPKLLNISLLDAAIM